MDAIELPPNAHDNLAGRPGIYRKAAACYYASDTELDEQFGRLLERIEKAVQLDRTIVLFTSDHGQLLGARGMYCKNFSAAEEIYNIPLIMSGPGIARGVVCDARVGLHDLCPSLLELTDASPICVPDSRSFASVLKDPQRGSDLSTGFAEYYGTRTLLTKRVVWDGSWKFVFNGFDFDELYDLAEDPYELSNLAALPGHQDRLRQMTALMWEFVRDTGDHSLLNSHYPILRVAPSGPLIAETKQVT